MEQKVTKATKSLGLQLLNPRADNTSVHPNFAKADELSHEVIAAAIEVHRDKGPGLLESIYEWCLGCELELRGIPAVQQRVVRIRYKQFERDEPLRFDLLLDGCLLIEAKSAAEILPIHKAQLLSYMKLLNIPIGLVINFNVMKLTDGLARVILPGANRD